MATPLGTEVSYRMCIGCHQKYSEDTAVSSATGTLPDGSTRTGIACPSCGGELRDMVMTVHPTIDSAEDLVIDGIFQSYAFYDDKAVYRGRPYRVYEGPHDCPNFKGDKAVTVGPHGRSHRYHSCEPLRRFGVTPDSCSQFRTERLA